MKYILIIFLVLFSSNILEAQKVTPSSKIKLTKKYPQFKFLGKSNNQFITYRYGRNNEVLDVFDSNMRLKYSSNLNLNNNQEITKFWMLPGGGWIIINEKDKEDNVLLKVAKLDGKLNLSSKTMVLDTLEERIELVQNNIRTETSLNETHLAIYLPVFKSGKIDYFLFLVYDLNMQLVQRQKISSPKINESDFADVLVLNDGSFALILEKKNESKENNTFHIFHGSPITGLQEITYTSREPIFKKPKFEVDNDRNDIIVAGMYEYKFDKRGQRGGAYKFFTSKIDLDSGIEYVHNGNEFSPEFYRDLTGNESPEEIIQFFTFFVNRIIPKKDGGMVAFTESYYKSEEERYYNSNMMFYGPSFGNYVPITKYNFNDVLIFDFDEFGNITRVQIMRKRQVSENDNGAFSSFTYMNQQDKIRILFMNEIQKQSKYSEFTFDNENFGQNKSIFNVGEKEVLPLSKMAIQTGINEIVIPSLLNNQLSLIKVVYPQ